MAPVSPVPPPPPPSPPGATTPTSLTPASTPGPAATTKTASPCRSAALFTPAPGSPPTSLNGGRPKTQRWCNDSPPTGKSGGGALSFVEVLRLGAHPAASAAPSTPSAQAPAPMAPPTAAPPLAPRIVPAEDGHGLRNAARKGAQDEDGWSPVVGRRQRRGCGALRPRRLVPADLRGRCFNYLSPGHRAANCQSKTRCFRCRGLGHRSSRCSWQPSRRHPEAVRRPKQLAWRPKVVVADGYAPAVGGRPMAVAAGGQGSAAMDTPCEAPVAAQGRKRRHRPRRGRSKGYGVSEDDADDAVAAPPMPGGTHAQQGVDRRLPRKFLDRSASISEREDGLSKDLVVTMISGNANDILSIMASRFEIEVSSLSLKRFGEGRFLLILPNVDTAVRVFDGGRPFISTSPPLRLHLRRWDRLLDSRAASLDCPVEVELRGIPAHAWDLSTAELLLCDGCWIGGVHPDVADRRDVYKVMAWCSCPASILTELELEIVEPPLVEADQHPMKHTLIYPIKALVRPAGRPARPADPSQPLADDGGRRRRNRRRRSRSPPAGSPRVSVHDQLGPRSEQGGHVAPRGSTTTTTLLPDDPTALAAFTPQAVASTPEAQGRGSSSAGTCLEAVMGGGSKGTSSISPLVVPARTHNASMAARTTNTPVDWPVDVGSSTPVLGGPSSALSPARPLGGLAVAAQCPNIREEARGQSAAL
ncbi:unnamed protein product [Urochloa humidicola]